MPIAASVTSVLLAIVDEAKHQNTHWLLLGLLATGLVSRLSANNADLRARRQLVLLLVGLHLLLLPITGFSSAVDAGVARELRLTSSVMAAFAAVGMAGLIVFGSLLPRLRVSVPRILQDVIVAGFGIIAVFGTASRAGVNLSGIVATGAVLTAVIGLALQDTLGNVIGGLSLQLDATIRVGDWIRVENTTGRVIEIRWRSTSVETRNNEMVVIPNSVLTRSQVTVVGRRADDQPMWRRWVWFQVDYRTAPTLVIDTVLKAICTQPIANVAPEPTPTCVLMELGDSTAKYAVRYWLSDLVPDDVTDSIVRTRIYFALTRAGIPLAIPAQSVFVTEDSQERREQKRLSDHAQRAQALASIELFAALSNAEREELANALHEAPFAAGEVLTREGAEAHHLYTIKSGRVSVRVSEGHREREVNQLGDGEYFGEMSLLTGNKREATVVALTDVYCYRLDANAFRHVLERRPDLAEKVASQLAERRVQLLATRERLGDRTTTVQEDSRDLLRQIRSFFGL